MSEAKSVSRKILLLYLTTTGVFLAIFFYLWYDKLYDELVLKKSANLSATHRTIVLSVVNAKFTPLSQICHDISAISQIKFAIIDNDSAICDVLSTPLSREHIKRLNDERYEGRVRGIYEGRVFFTFIMRSSDFFLGQDDELNGVSPQNENFLYTFIEGEDVREDLFVVRLQVILGAILSFFVISFVAYFLVKIALKPLENKIKTLNLFIKDFTHEINTPLSVILLSIEQLENAQNEREAVKFKRMKVAAKTLSQTYSDLVFLSFPDTISNEEEELLMCDVISERLEYFRLFFEQKKLTLSVNLQGRECIFASKSKINKMLDNLISNAIKYNKKGGFIAVNLAGRRLSIKDSGYGIDEKNLQKIFERYARFNADQGGFGIGLSLVKEICKEYKIKISCHSKLNEGSEFVVEF